MHSGYQPTVLEISERKESITVLHLPFGRSKHFPWFRGGTEVWTQYLPSDDLAIAPSMLVKLDSQVPEVKFRSVGKALEWFIWSKHKIVLYEFHSLSSGSCDAKLKPIAERDVAPW